MILDKLVETFAFAKDALEARSYRQELLVSNIANADAPGYKAVDVDFSSTMSTALAHSNQGEYSGDSQDRRKTLRIYCWSRATPLISPGQTLQAPMRFALRGCGTVSHLNRRWTTIPSTLMPSALRPQAMRCITSSNLALRQRSSC
jgi:hypothetical protein